MTTPSLYGGGAPPPVRRGPAPVYHPPQHMPCAGPACPSGGGGFTTFRPQGPGYAAPTLAIPGNPYGLQPSGTAAGGIPQRGAGGGGYSQPYYPSPTGGQLPAGQYYGGRGAAAPGGHGAYSTQPNTLGPAQFGLPAGVAAPAGTVPVTYLPVAYSAPAGMRQQNPPPTFGFVPSGQAPVGSQPKLVMGPTGALLYEFGPGVLPGG